MCLCDYLYISIYQGGAPELCTEFRHLAKGCADLGRKVIDRCNLTALLEPGRRSTFQKLMIITCLYVFCLSIFFT